MFEVLSKISFESVGESSRLFLDYLSAIERGVPPFIPGMVSDVSFWKQRAESTIAPAVGGEVGWRAVVEAVHAHSRRLGAGEATLEKIEKLKSRDACCVVTGQQPGVLGGPLMTLYKVTTAVALAERIEAMVGKPCVPIYWCGSDDVDFQEIRGFHLLTKDASPVSATLPQESHQSGLPVGDIAAEWIRQLWGGIRGFVHEFDPARAEKIEGVVTRGRDHGEIASGVLVDLLGGRIAVVDGRSPAVRTCARGLITEYVRSEKEVKHLIRDAGSRLEKEGYHAQLAPGRDSGVFLMEDGRRKTVAPENHRALIAAAESDVTRCVPGVALRNLVQDSTFRPVAVVLGPAEIAYRAQIAGLYERFVVPRPVDFPRMTATFVPARLGELLCGAEDLIRDPAGCARRVYRDSVPLKLREAADDFRRQVEESAGVFLKEVDAESGDRSRGRIRSRVKEVQARTAQALDAVEDAGKRIALERWPFLSDLAQLIRPEDKLQERHYAGLSPFLFGRADADATSLVALATAHADELLDGHPSHIVYSVRT